MSATHRSQRIRAKRKQEELRRLKKLRLDAGMRTEAKEAKFQDHDQDEEDHLWRKRKFLLGLLILPFCLLALLIFFELLFQEAVGGSFWKSEGFWFFAFGCVCWLSMNWMRRGHSLLYVFAHEMTHAITARLSGGRVHGMKIARQGGYVDTDKTSTLITLSPYLVPFYTTVVLALYGLVGLAVDMELLREWNVLGWAFRLKWVWVFYFLVGFTWCFHLTFTMQVLEIEQSDLRHNGEFFSMMLIILINIIILGVLFVAASPSVEWVDVWNEAKSLLRYAWRLAS